jgi:hypothetical protein
VQRAVGTQPIEDGQADGETSAGALDSTRYMVSNGGDDGCIMRDVLINNVITGGLCVKNAVLNRVYLADKKRFFVNFRVTSIVWYVHLATQNTVSTV